MGNVRSVADDLDRKTDFYSVDKNGKWGCIDVNGKVVLPIRYNFPVHFFDGVALIKVGEKWGYMNKTGKTIIAPRFISASVFNRGLALTLSDDRRWEFINKTGKVVVRVPQGYSTDRAPFREGLAKVYVNEPHGPHGRSGIETARSTTGFINMRGQWAVKPQYLSAGRFNGGLAPVSVGSGQVGKKPQSGFIDRTGKMVIAPRFDGASEMISGLAAVKKNGKSFFINKIGVRAFPAEYEDALWFSDGFAAVKVRGKWGYINTSGTMKIKPQFKTPGFFHNGLANFSVGGKSGYISKTGKAVVPPTYDYVEPFYNPLARVFFFPVTLSEFGAGYINRAGKEVWAPAPKTKTPNDFAKGFGF